MRKIEMKIKERPILFSGPMVRAILDGRKTQTRRLVTDKHFKRLGLERDGEFIYTSEGPQWNGEFEGEFWSPYGKPGDRLWVREAWFCATGEPGPIQCHYKADYEEHRFGGLWRSPRFMPRWASRITLEVTETRIERLHDIGEADAQAEGAKETVCLPGDCGTFLPSFRNRWYEIHGDKSWDENPWVWVVEFKRI